MENRAEDKGKKNLKELIEAQKKDLFSEIDEYLSNDKITDIEWDGCNLWITELGKGCYKVDKKLTAQFIANLSIRLSNIMKTNFNVANPVMEAHTEDLRISIFHESRSESKSLTIRKIPTTLRYDHETIVNSKMMPEELLNLLENCVMAHSNIVIGGRPHAGKTELLKYLSGFIPVNEKVVTLEDNAEIHYRQIHPGRKCVPFLVDEKFDYSDAIKACLRHNADWLLLSEARGPEIVELLNALSTGSFCMTTVHVDGAKDIPDRMYNMLGDSGESPRFINNIYRYIDIGMVVKADKQERRIVSELGFFERKPVKKIDKYGIEHEDVENVYIPFYNAQDGLFEKNNIPDEILDKFQRLGITNPYERPKTPEDIIYGEGVSTTAPLNEVKKEAR